VRINEPCDVYESSDFNAHGRHEYRRCEVYDDTWGIAPRWEGLVHRIVQITSGVQTMENPHCYRVEKHLYISSLDTDAQTFLHIIRSHWGIENSLHYVKDVTFNEDHSRIRTHQAPGIATILRSLAINLLNRSHFKNLKLARKSLAWNPRMVFSLIGT